MFNNYFPLFVMFSLTLILGVTTKAMNLHKIFVYGTLKRNEPNHSWFAKNAEGYYKYIGDAKTVEKLPLIIATKYNVPFILKSPGNGTFITGEVYEIDNKVLADLDILEDYPNLYTREKFDVRLLDGSNSLEEVWIYVVTNFLPKLLNEEFYGTYVSSESHGRPFVPRHMRTEGNGTNIIGEVYEVDDKVFADLDILEEYPDFYTREQFDVTLLNGGSSVKVWIYVIQNFNPKLLNETCYESYSNSGSHGKPYDPRDASTLEELNA